MIKYKIFGSTNNLFLDISSTELIAKVFNQDIKLVVEKKIHFNNYNLTNTTGSEIFYDLKFINEESTETFIISKNERNVIFIHTSNETYQFELFRIEREGISCFLSFDELIDQVLSIYGLGS